jgi:hypothetical protein
MSKVINNKQVFIVHSIDTEGPLFESLQAKFDMLQELYGIDHVEPSIENVKNLQNKKIDLAGQEDEIALFLSNQRIRYNDSWDKIDSMLDIIMTTDYRNQLLDSYGSGWVFNWHCVDHVGYDNNPRRRDMGYHNIFDHYRDFIRTQDNSPDGVHWHFHPMSTYKDAHYCATSYINSPELYQILCRRIIERNWFPSVNRAGFHVERPDSHAFLEQWIPFDISNIALDDNSELQNSASLRDGRLGDWRLAPSDWSHYQPSHDNYQIPGNCRRWIARCLFLLNRVVNFDQHESDKAFFRANGGQPTIVGIVSHDFRDMELEINHAREIIANSSERYPNVDFKFCEAVEAFRLAIWPEGISDEPLDFELTFHPKSSSNDAHIEVTTKKGDVFGPQPFLSIKTKSNRFIHDNFDFTTEQNRWLYPFYSNTLPIDDVSKIGVAANDKYGNMCIKRLNFKDGRVFQF